MAEPVKYYTILDWNVKFTGMQYISAKDIDEVENVQEMSIMLDIAAFSSEEKNIDFTSGLLLYQGAMRYSAVKDGIFKRTVSEKFKKALKYNSILKKASKKYLSKRHMHFGHYFVFLTLDEMIKNLDWFSIFVAEVEPIEVVRPGPMGECKKLKILNITKIQNHQLWKNASFATYALHLNPICCIFLDELPVEFRFKR